MNINFLKNNKTVPELWKREKSDFRIWIIAGSISFALSSILSLIIFLLRAFNNQEFTNSINFFISTLQLKDTQEITQHKTNLESIEWNKIIIFAVFSTLLVSISTYFYISLYNSYAKKDFSYIAEWPIFIYTFIAIWFFVSLMLSFTKSHPGSLHASMFGVNNLSFLGSNSPTIVKATIGLEIVSSIVIALTYFAFVRKVRQIRHLFVISKRSTEVAAILKERMDTLKHFNPYADLELYNQRIKELQKEIQNKVKKEEAARATESQSSQATSSKQQEEATRFNYLEPEFLKTDLFKKISSLDHQKLNKIAQKLSIAGFEFLTKEELLKKVLQIFEQEWSESKGKT